MAAEQAGPVQELLLGAVKVGPRVRRPRRSRIEALKAHLQAGGSAPPLRVVRRGEVLVDLVAGAVTLEAYREIGRVTVPACVEKLTKAQARWAEVEDNLFQDGLTVLERAQLLAAAKALYEADGPNTGHGGDRSGSKIADSANLAPRFTLWAAQRYGRSERTIQIACAIGAGIDPAAAGIVADTAFTDRASELTSLAKLAPETQRQVAQLLTRAVAPAASVAEALGVIGERVEQPDLFSKVYGGLLGRWSKLGVHGQRKLVSSIVRLVPREWVEEALRSAEGADVA